MDNGSKTGGTLTVSDGVDKAKILLVGNYVNATFACGSDGQGGVSVTISKPGADPPPESDAAPPPAPRCAGDALAARA